MDSEPTRSMGIDGHEPVDPVQFEVIRYALTAATEEMAAALRRSAYSTNVKTRADFSCAIFDRDIRLVAQSFSQPVHLGSMSELVPQALRTYGADRLRPGDAIVTNDPYSGGGHLNDVTVIAPVWYDGALFGYVASLAHHVDIGGGAPASVGAYREVYQEGIIVPPVKIMADGDIVDDVFRLILAQIRSKHETGGDFRAQVAANNTGVRRLCALLEKHGGETVTRYIDELISYTARRTRHSAGALPRGRFSAEGVVDTDGFSDDPVRLVATVTIDEDGVRFDFTGCDPQRRAPVDSTYAQTFAACAYVLRCLIDEDVPVNAGFYESVRLNAPPGSVVNCTHPSPVVGGWETAMRLIDVIFKALATPLPDRVAAGCKAMICHAGFGGIGPTGDYYCFLETLAGGYGGRHGLDGPDAVQAHGQNTENAPVEETERNYPVRILRYELVENSEGAGEFRGGLGLRRDYCFLDHEASFSILADRDREGPWGLFGGLSGQRAEYLLNPDTDAVRLRSKMTLEVQPGQVISYRTCGGGGYGDPTKRDPQRVLTDVRDGKVSLARALSVYQVAIDRHTWTVDKGETAARRGETPRPTEGDR